MNMPRRIKALLGGVLVLAGVTLAFVWTQCRVYVAPDQCLVLIRKTGAAQSTDGSIAAPGQKGIQRDTLGPGRYFLNPWVWDWELHKLTVVSAGNPRSWSEHYDEAVADVSVPESRGEWPQVGILVNKVGKPTDNPDGVVEEGFQGIQKNVLTPGSYRINPYYYEVRLVPATVVPLGCCGVVTSQLGEMPGNDVTQTDVLGPDGQPVPGHPRVIQRLASEGQRGVQKDVLQPGIHYLNPYLYKVQIVQVGYNQISQLKGGDASTHITFPSKDGFTIDVEVTVVWGRHPAHTAEMINRFGDITKIKEIVIGQMRSICRNLGSDYESTDFIRGEKRELYQRAVTETLRKVCHERDIEVLIALIHNIEVHGSRESEREGMDLKKTIQRGFIAREQDLTKQAQRETAKVRATLETSKAAIEIARERITSDTRKKAAAIAAEGEKTAQETEAQRDLGVATIERQIAELDAQTTRVLGKARTQVEQLVQQADADGKRLLVEAFGSGRAYNLYTFTQGFAPESIRLIFAGEGTLWTDLARMQDVAATKLLQPGAETKTEGAMK